MFEKSPSETKHFIIMLLLLNNWHPEKLWKAGEKLCVLTGCANGKAWRERGWAGRRLVGSGRTSHLCMSHCPPWQACLPYYSANPEHGAHVESNLLRLCYVSLSILVWKDAKPRRHGWWACLSNVIDSLVNSNYNLIIVVSDQKPCVYYSPMFLDDC